MTRQLVLIRHAKSADGPVDVERPLAPRGRRDARAVGQLLSDSGVDPERVVVSPARRARQTWDAACTELSGPGEVIVDGRIYDNDAQSLYEVIRDTPAQVGTLVLVGHNPSFSELATELDDAHGDREGSRELRAGYPTGAVAVYDVPVAWSEVGPQSATLRTFVVPRAGRDG